MKSMIALATGCVFAAALASNASACSKTNYIGTWTDQYGATATLTANGGTTTAPIVCSGTYTVIIDKITAKKGIFTAKLKGCPTLKATLTYGSTCNTASGPVKIQGGGTLQDSWTKQSGGMVPPARSTLTDSLFSGMK